MKVIRTREQQERSRRDRTKDAEAHNEAAKDTEARGGGRAEAVKARGDGIDDTLIENEEFHDAQAFVNGFRQRSGE